MARIVTCSQCKTSLSVPDDMLGKLVRCPNCSITFSAPQTSVQANPELAPPPLPKSFDRDEPLEDRDPRGRRRDRRDDDDDDYRDRRDFDDDFERDRRSDRDYGSRRMDSAWLTVKSGLNAMFIGSLIVVGTGLVCFLLVVIIGISEAGGGRRNNPATGVMAGLLICMGILVVLGGGITSLVGRFMCLAAPEPRGRGFMIGHLIFLALNCVLAVVLFVVLIGMESARNPPDRRNLQVAMGMLGSLQVLIFLGSAVFLNLFFKGVAQSFNNSSLAGGCTAFLVFESIWLIAGTALTLLSLGLEPNNLAQEGRLIAWTVGAVIIGGVGGLVSVIWNLVLIRGCQNTIRQAQEENQRKRYYD